uniref:SEFIR domain-containing protein n=1 Tax=Astyanax mexicanus TaxID=7994 RepID=A0A8B9HSR7_ASTMX
FLSLTSLFSLLSTLSFLFKAGVEEVLLLHAGGADPGGVCVLVDQLSDLGLGVCSDLSSQKEVGSCGPGPWLHSKLAQLQKPGGKVLLMLSDPALDTAQACWDSWTRERTGPADYRTPPCSSDVFGYALNCIFTARLKGGAAERFALVQFDSQRLLDGDRLVPELFRGLDLYSLPSDSRRLLLNCGKGLRPHLNSKHEPPISYSVSGLGMGI